MCTKIIILHHYILHRACSLSSQDPFLSTMHLLVNPPPKNKRMVDTCKIWNVCLYWYKHNACISYDVTSFCPFRGKQHSYNQHTTSSPVLVLGNKYYTGAKENIFGGPTGGPIWHHKKFNQSASHSRPSRTFQQLFHVSTSRGSQVKERLHMHSYIP